MVYGVPSEVFSVMTSGVSSAVRRSDDGHRVGHAPCAFGRNRGHQAGIEHRELKA